MEKREALKVWTVLLAMLAFSLSLLGTFLVRSGVLTSVHAFARDPERGVFILVHAGVLHRRRAGAVCAARASAARGRAVRADLARGRAGVQQSAAAPSLRHGLRRHALSRWRWRRSPGEKISVGAPYFNGVLIPIALPLAVAIPIGQMLPWKRGDLIAAVQRLRAAFVVGVVGAAALGAWHGTPALSILCAGVALYLIVGAFTEVVLRVAARQPGVIARRLLGLPLSAYGAALAHAGVGLTLLGLAAVGWGAETIAAMSPGDATEVGPYQVAVESIASREGPNYTETYAPMSVRVGGRQVALIQPSTRYYQARKTARSEAGIATLGFGQVYVAIGAPRDGGGLDVRLYYKPLVTLIWIGALAMAAGGVLSLADRRLRIGAPRRASLPAALPEAAE